MVVFTMTIDIKVQSVSDIITNSSSEVFLCTEAKGVSRIYELLNAILQFSGMKNTTAESMFEIEDCDSCYVIKALSPEYEELADKIDGINDLFFADGRFDN